MLTKYKSSITLIKSIRMEMTLDSFVIAIFGKKYNIETRETKVFKRVHFLAPSRSAFTGKHRAFHVNNITRYNVLYQAQIHKLHLFFLCPKGMKGDGSGAV
ncbi:hypothetical protein [Klebsiella pneumoniae]|uniref:hypothetical protein n=1 Tax=Klebsiella pneumoniae TaxID=573 RepID=UPI0015E2843C|nr:hypothetical protein [Klebsiella pneumoniae]